MEVKNYKFKDGNELKEAVNLLLENKPNKYGDIRYWDVSDVTDMRELFYDSNFNADISRWNVSKVTDMRNMFRMCHTFNQDIGQWDVSNVINMEGMFWDARTFNNGDSGNNSANPLTWNVSQVTTMNGMFYCAEAFNQAIGQWDVSQVTDMNSMFEEAHNFNQDIGQWNVSNVINMEGMFRYARDFNQAIGQWDMSQVSDMKGMFRYARNFNQDIGQWDVSQVTTMAAMFAGAAAFNNGDSENNSANPLTWNVSQVTDINSMFYEAHNFNQDIGRWPIKEDLVLDDTFMHSGLSRATFLKPPDGTGKGVYGVQIGTYFDLLEPYVSYDTLLQSIIDKRNFAKARVVELLYRDLDDKKVKNKLEVEKKRKVFEQLDIGNYLGGSLYRITYTE